MGQALCEAMAGLGEQVGPRLDAQRGRPDLETLGEHPDLLPPPDHQRRARRAEQRDPGHQQEGLRLQKPGAIRTAIYFFCGGLDLYQVSS